MTDFEPTVEDARFLHELRQHVRANPSLYRAAGAWLDQEYSAEACWRREVERVELENREWSAHHPDHQFEPREKRIVEAKLCRICEAVNCLIQDDSGLVTAPTWDIASRLLLLCWVLTDEAAHEFKPRLCEFQGWGWDGDPDQQFSRLWSQAVLPKAADWRKWLDLCRKAWVTLPDATDRSPSERLNRITDALDLYVLKVNVCLTPDNPKWVGNTVAEDVLWSIRDWKLNKDGLGHLPPHLVAGTALKRDIADEVDIVLDSLPELGSRWQDEFNGLWLENAQLAEKFKEGKDDYESSLIHMELTIAPRAASLADRVRRKAWELQKIAPEPSARKNRNAGAIKQKKTTAEEAKRWAETYLKNHLFPGLNELARHCAAALTTMNCVTTCSPHTMRKAIGQSEPLQKAEAAYKLQSGKPGPKPRSTDDPAWNTEVDEALRILLESTPKAQRDTMDAEQLRHELAKNTPGELAALVEDAQAQAEKRRKASVRARARTPQ